ncbi:MAG: hypothetical protein V4520_14340 [Bacteroidota bacterium]
MNVADLIKNFLTIVIAVLGWIIAHHYSSKRDRRNKKREIITAHLIKAYIVLANDFTQRELQEETKAKLELLIGELQLFGSQKQIDLAEKLAQDIHSGGRVNFDELVNDIRNELRNELELQPIQEDIFWIRYKN